VPGARPRQVCDQAADRAAAHQHDRPDDQARHALEALRPVSAYVLAIGCRHTTLLHSPAGGYEQPDMTEPLLVLAIADATSGSLRTSRGSPATHCGPE